VQDLVKLKMSALGKLPRPIDDLRRQPAALRDGKGVGRSGLAGRELIQRLQPFFIEGHGAVKNARHLACHHL
jgi:hypothetical protein